MTYKINNVTITIQPTSGRWMPRKSFGIDGNGHMLYSRFREFELKWSLLPPDSVYQLQNFFNGIGSTGVYVVSLPKYANSSYTFANYSGCVLREPEFEVYFEQHYTDVVLIVSSINTDQVGV